jgi:hypothetical protein
LAANAILIGLEPWGIKITLILLGKAVGTETVGRSDNLALDVVEGLLRFPQETALPARIVLFGEGDLETERQNLLSYPWQEPERKLSFLHFPKVEIGPENFELLSLCLAGGTELAKADQLVEIPRLDEKEERVDLGFVAEKDVLAERVTEPERIEKIPEPDYQPKSPPKPKVNQVFSLAKKIPGLVRAILGKVPKPPRPSFSLSLPLFLILSLVVLILATGGFYAFRSLARAKVTLFVVPQDLNREFNLTISPTISGIDEKTKTVPGELVEAQISESKTGQTTGKKMVGEKAKGEVIIYNRTEAKKSFPAGTILIGAGQFKFSLDAEVSVASKSPDLASGVDRWGEAKANLTAQDIGAVSNLASNSQFSFLNFPSSAYLAKNPAALAGGNSRQIQAVSEKDQTDLLRDLTADLTEKAKTELRAKVESGQQLIDESLAVKTAKKEFDRQVGEEAQTLSLNLSLSASALVFEENTLKDFSERLLLPNVSNLELRREETKMSFKTIKVNPDQSVLFEVNLVGKLYPKIDQEEIAKNLAGKSLGFSQNYLGNLPRVSGLETKISPAIFNRLGRFPPLSGNIQVEVMAK